MQRFALTVLSVALAAASCGTAGPASTGGDGALAPDDPVEPRIGSFAGTEPAPEFPDGLDWINVARPLSIAELRGKVVILDFWTYGCINCLHVIPDLKRLESEYPDELVVVGVHSAKFENEAQTDNIRDVVARYDLEHPVVNDKEFLVWRQWGAQAWPTLVLIDPAGNIVGGHSGEGVYPIFQPVVDSLVEEFDDLGLIDRTPIEVVLERDRLPDSVLSFPGKVLADPASRRLFVADTNHHRLIIADLDTGEVLDVIGGVEPGFEGGGYRSARFDQPQGMALSDDGSTLYVADTGNHSVRRVDLEQRSVSTVLGTGLQADRYPPMPGEGASIAVSSPWDVFLSGQSLLVAMAGSHQIWTLDLDSGAAEWYVGNGRESTRNGPRLEAELAQPSALVSLPDGRVAFADSESSSIRFAEHDGGTGVLAGTDEGLFDFGDEDGVGTAARLQHPLGLDFGDGYLWVADTYNSKIKRLDPGTGEIVTFAGEGQGWRDGSGVEAAFSEPGGVSFAEGVLYVADTNNHVVRRIDLGTGEVSTLVLYGIERFPSSSSTAAPVTEVAALEVSPGAGTVAVDVELPAGYKVNDLAPFSMAWETEGTEILDGDRAIVAPTFPLQLDADFSDGHIAVELTVYYCTNEAESLCFIDQARLEADVVTVPGASSEAVIGYSIAEPGL